MRVSTSQVYAQPLTRILELQRNSLELQEQIATGRRINSPGDDPVGAAAVLGLRDRLQALEQYERNGVLAEQRLSQVDDVLNGMSNVLQRTRELLIQGRNEVYGDGDRKAIAAEIREQIDVLVELGNTRNASGDYVFAGASVTTRPFTRDATLQVSYNGDQTVRRLQVSETRSVEESFSGEQAFMGIRNGNGTFVTAADPGNAGTAQIGENGLVDPTAYQRHDFRVVFTSATTYDVVDDTSGATLLSAQPYVSGDDITFAGVSLNIFGTPAAGDQFSVTPSANQSVFETLRELVVTLETGYGDAASRARFGFEMDRSIENLDMALERVLELRATTGARINTIEGQRDTNADVMLNLRTLRSGIEDLDLTAAISELALETTALEAAQAAFVRVQGLSLFNFI